MGWNQESERSIEWLLDYEGRVHVFEGGYYVKFEFRKVAEQATVPHRIKYSMSLHAPDGTRLMGFDNAHPVERKAGAMKRRSAAADHWHRDENDSGRPYTFIDVQTLLEDFEKEVERKLSEKGVSVIVVRVDQSH
ncbi:MAG: hypothetical protein EXR27_16755 [Betaproteobacteria bacterium]|nr:hypothetical protein [Betaproteobacteria bacterium]